MDRRCWRESGPSCTGCWLGPPLRAGPASRGLCSPGLLGPPLFSSHPFTVFPGGTLALPTGARRGQNVGACPCFHREPRRPPALVTRPEAQPPWPRQQPSVPRAQSSPSAGRARASHSAAGSETTQEVHHRGSGTRNRGQGPGCKEAGKGASPPSPSPYPPRISAHPGAVGDGGGAVPAQWGSSSHEMLGDQVPGSSEQGRSLPDAAPAWLPGTWEGVP